MEFETIKDSIHYVFDTNKEFKQYFSSQGIPAPPIQIDWRKANELDWVMSDDGRIVQILRKGSMEDTCRSPDKKQHATAYVGTIVGTFPVRATVKMDTDFSARKNRYTFSKKFSDHKQAIRDREKNNRGEEMFVYFVSIVRDDPAIAYMKVYGTKNYRWARARSYLLMKQERIRLAIRQELKEVAKDLSMDDKFHLEKLKTIINDKDSSDNAKIMALRLSGEWTGVGEKVDPDDLPPIPTPDTGKKIEDSPDKKRRLEASEKSIKETKSINAT